MPGPDPLGTRDSQVTMLTPASRRAGSQITPVRFRTLAWVGLAACLISGCRPDSVTPGVLLHTLSARRAACEGLGGEMAGSWSSAIHNNQSADLALAATLNSSTNLQRISEIDIREKQVARLFAELGNSATPEIKTLLLDIASQVEGLCSVVQEPAGFSMAWFNEKRSELLVDLD